MQLARRCCTSGPARAAHAAAITGSWHSAAAAAGSSIGRASAVAVAAAFPAARCQSHLFAASSWTTAAVPAVFRRALHLSSVRRSSAVPSGPSYDAPLPTLAAVARIDPSELEIDPSCTARLEALARKAGHPVHLRVLVDQGGCSGLEYKFEVHKDPSEEPEEEDIVIPIGSSGCNVWVDRDSWLWLRGSRVEYLQELARSAFVVASNPNATQACGCKSSFAPKMDPRTGKPVAMAAETAAPTPAAVAAAAAPAPKASL